MLAGRCREASSIHAAVRRSPCGQHGLIYIYDVTTQLNSRQHAARADTDHVAENLLQWKAHPGTADN